MKERFFDSLPSEDITENIPLTSKGMLIGIILPEARIQKTPYSPQVEIINITRVTHDPLRSILVVVGQTPDKIKICQYFWCPEVKTVPLNFSAS